jgi:uncharacterized protein YcnI
MRSYAVVAAGVLLGAATLSAHVTVSPLQSKAGATQSYELRVHNENEKKLATTSIDLELPAGVTLVSVGKPPSGTYKTRKDGDRVTMITWTIDVPADKYVALPFTAKNAEDATDLVWRAHQHLAGGSVIEWSDAPGAKEKASVTKITR